MEAAAHFEQRLRFHRRRDETRRGGRQGNHFGLLPEGLRRSTVEGRSGHQRVARLDAEVLPRGKPARAVQRLRLLRRPNDGARSQAGWKRSQPRPCDETGGQHQGSGAADAPSRHQDQYEPDGLLPDRTGAARSLRWRALGALRGPLRYEPGTGYPQLGSSRFSPRSKATGTTLSRGCGQTAAVSAGDQPPTETALFRPASGDVLQAPFRRQRKIEHVLNAPLSG